MKGINIPPDVFAVHFAPYLSPFRILDLLSVCPNSDTQWSFSQNEIWEFYFQHYLSFINVHKDINGALCLKKEENNHWVVLEDKKDIYLKRGNVLYIQKQDGQLLPTRYKTALIAEIRNLLVAIKNNNNNWWEKLSNSELLRSDKLFMYEAINRNSEAYKLLSPALKQDRELLCAAVKKDDSYNLTRYVPRNRQLEINVNKTLRIFFITFLTTQLLLHARKYKHSSADNNILGLHNIILLFLTYSTTALACIKPYAVYGLFAKKYPGNYIESYEETPEEHKNDESSDDEDNDVLLPLNI